MIRPIWTGSIGFGLVNIPVKLYSAVEDSRLDLDMLDKTDMSNIHFKKVNARTGKEVPLDNIVRAYKYNGHYVVLSPDDLKAASAKKSEIIEVISFINDKEIDSIYYETPYYLEPEKSGYRAYGLLREAMKKSGRAGLASFILRNSAHLAVLKPSGPVIVLNRIRFFEEIRDVSGLDLPNAEQAGQQELQMALTLIEQLSAKFDIKNYKDTFTGSLMEVIRKKDAGKNVIPFKRKEKSISGDLMSQLKESLNSMKKEKAVGR